MINNNFSTIMGKKRLKISKVSRDTGISRTTLTSLYYGKSQKVSLDVMDRLCQYLGCTFGDLFESSSKYA